jgi:hypothetical protein
VLDPDREEELLSSREEDDDRELLLLLMLGGGEGGDEERDIDGWLNDGGAGREILGAGVELYCGVDRGIIAEAAGLLYVGCVGGLKEGCRTVSVRAEGWTV